MHELGARLTRHLSGFEARRIRQRAQARSGQQVEHAVFMTARPLFSQTNRRSNRHAQVFDDQIIINAVVRTFAAQTRLLHTTERRDLV